MESDNPVVLVIIALIGAASGILAWWQNHQTERRVALLAQQKVDSEAYDRARAIFSASIVELEDRIRRLKQELAEAQAEKESLKARVEELERMVTSLRVKLKIAGIALD